MPRKKRFSTAGSCSSAAKVGGNDDLLTEILVLLPTKTVVRFKTVCKRWLSLISGEIFTDVHIQNHRHRCVETQHSFILAHSSGRSQIFICHPRVKNKLVRVSLPRPIIRQPFQKVTIVQSANGLLLLSLKFPDRLDYVVFNPATKQYRLIDLDGHRPIKVCLIFDPSKSKHYKLAMTTSAVPPFSVYDSATHQWSHGKDSRPFFVYEESSSMLCKLALCSLTLISHQSTHHLLLVPGNYNEYENYIIESNQHLSVLQLNKERRNKIWFRVSVMIDDKWVIRKRSIRIDFGNKTIGLLGMIREESIEDSAILFHVPGKLLIYSFSNGLEVLVDYRSDYFYEEDQLQFQYAHPFIHSFAPV